MRTAMLSLLMAFPVLGACAATQTAGEDPNRGNYQKPVTPLLKLPEYSKITGGATYRERIALPPGSILDVQLLDVAKQDVAATKIDEVRYDMTGSSVPVGFELKLPNQELKEYTQLIVRAQIRDAGGKLLFTTDQVYPVMSRPVDQDIGMVVMVMVPNR